MLQCRCDIYITHESMDIKKEDRLYYPTPEIFVAECFVCRCRIVQFCLFLLCFNI